MSTYIKKYIITGAPGTGKTTLVNALAENYPCVHEVSRKVIVNEQEKGRTGTPWQDMNRFAELVYKASIVELEANPQALFIDRSILDLTAYLQVEAKPIPLSISSFRITIDFIGRYFSHLLGEAFTKRMSKGYRALSTVWNSSGF